MKAIYKSTEGERLVLERYQTFLKYWPVPNQQVRVPTSQGETFVIISGPENAPALILLHGGMMNSSMWMGEVTAFARFFRVYCIDMIGEPGLSAPARPPLASDAYAVWLDDVLDHLAVARASILGASLGGWLALDYAIRRPERVERVAVLCPGGIGRQKVGIVFATLLSRIIRRTGKAETDGTNPRPRTGRSAAAREGLSRFRSAHSKAFPAANGAAPGVPGQRAEGPEYAGAGDRWRTRCAARFSADEAKTGSICQRGAGGVSAGGRARDRRSNSNGAGIHDVRPRLKHRCCRGKPPVGGYGHEPGSRSSQRCANMSRS